MRQTARHVREVVGEIRSSLDAAILALSDELEDAADGLERQHRTAVRRAAAEGT